LQRQACRLRTCFNSLARALQRLAIIVFFSSVKSAETDCEDGSARRGGTMSADSPKVRITGGKAAKLSQRVEDNAFHQAGSASPKTMTDEIAEGANTGGKAAKISQRVGDNAFYLGGSASPKTMVS